MKGLFYKSRGRENWILCTYMLGVSIFPGFWRGWGWVFEVKTVRDKIQVIDRQG